MRGRNPSPGRGHHHRRLPGFNEAGPARDRIPWAASWRPCLAPAAAPRPRTASLRFPPGSGAVAITRRGRALPPVDSRGRPSVRGGPASAPPVWAPVRPAPRRSQRARPHAGVGPGRRGEAVPHPCDRTRGAVTCASRGAGYRANRPGGSAPLDPGGQGSRRERPGNTAVGHPPREARRGHRPSLSSACIPRHRSAASRQPGGNGRFQKSPRWSREPRRNGRFQKSPRSIRRMFSSRASSRPRFRTLFASASRALGGSAGRSAPSRR